MNKKIIRVFTDVEVESITDDGAVEMAISKIGVDSVWKAEILEPEAGASEGIGG